MHTRRLVKRSILGSRVYAPSPTGDGAPVTGVVQAVKQENRDVSAAGSRRSVYTVLMQDGSLKEFSEEEIAAGFNHTAAKGPLKSSLKHSSSNGDSQKLEGGSLSPEAADDQRVVEVKRASRDPDTRSVSLLEQKRKVVSSSIDVPHARQKKAANGHSVGDHENLMNGVSERETVSQSADSPATDLAVSSSHNGPLTSGTILTDTQDTSPQPSEEMLSSQSELRSSKCPQDRELPSIPPNNALIGDRPPPSGDSTYEVVKEIAAASRDISVEDSLYETVKELKDPPMQLGLPNGTAQLSPDEHPHPAPPTLLNGHLSPCTPERGPLCMGVEYASVDLNKKSRHSADVEAKRCSDNTSVPDKPLEEPEEDLPPPVPEKVLDENDNQPVVVNGLVGAGLHNGELPSPLSPAPGFDNHILSDNESPVYSTVNKTHCDNAVNEEDKEHDYSSIAEIKGLVPASSSSDLYATVNDIYTHPDDPQPGEDPILDSTDPGYETIRIPKTGSSDDEHRAGQGAEGSDAVKPEPDYESVGELGLSQELSRL